MANKMKKSNPMKEIFSKIEFWRIFTKHEVWDINEFQFNQHLDELKNNFKYREDLIEFEFEGKKEIAKDKIIEFEFDCGNKYKMVLEYTLEYRCEQSEGTHKLYLKNKLNNEKKLMGWMDICQWHPLCIAPEEFELLQIYWQEKDPIWKNTIYPKLLLKSYVGLHNPDEFNKYKKEITELFQSLEIKGLDEYSEEIIIVPFYGSQKYKWLLHEKLGWLYESEKYNCYSIRNECHSKSEHEKFPFSEWNEMIEYIENDLGIKCNIKTDEGNWEYEEPRIKNDFEDTLSNWNEEKLKYDDEDLPF